MRDIVWLEASLVLTVRSRVGMLVGHMLDERSTKSDVQHLDPTADAEEREIALQCSRCQSEFEPIPKGMEPIRRWVDDIVTEARRFHITTAAQEETVNGVEQRAGVAVLGRKDYRDPSGCKDRFDIRLCHRVPSKSLRP